MRKVILLPNLLLQLKTFFFLLLLSFFIIPGNFLKAQTTEDEEESAVPDIHHHSDIQRGERFFKGLLPKDRKYESCESCHNLTKSDNMNWNPSAMDIAKKMIGTNDVEYVIYPEFKNKWSDFFSDYSTRASEAYVSRQAFEFVKYYKYIRDAQNLQGHQTRIPFMVEIY